MKKAECKVDVNENPNPSAKKVFYPNLQNKWNKAFWKKECYAATIGNLTEEALKKYNVTNRLRQ